MSIKTTKVYDTYWRFATERQNILFRKLRGELQPYTNDSILLKYRFTNAYRLADRVSQYLIQVVIPNSKPNVEDVFFRIMLFKLFNKIGTWESLLEMLGEIHWKSYQKSKISRALNTIKKINNSIYSAAYIMPSGSKIYGSSCKHECHMSMLESMMKDQVPDKVSCAPNMKSVYEILCSYPMIGPFLGYQYATDINYSDLTDFSEMEFVVPGPGALDGIRKCFSDFGSYSASDLIRMMAEQQQLEFERLGLDFAYLGERPLQLIDCQNLFCEVDKYARVAHPEVQGLSGRSRIKQQYRPDINPFTIKFPPKWGGEIAIAQKESFDANMLFR
tara:strand:+ start:398 stop:1390 length:993 start_codon:yes stop_codon:yes gene_type:complete